MSSGLEAQGVLLKRGDGATPEVFTAIAEITGFDGPSGSASVIDMTHLSSTAKEKKMGLMDEGQISIDGNLVTTDTQQEGLRDDRTARTLRNFQLVLTDSPSTTLSFAAYVLTFSISGQVDGKIPFKCTLEISGQVTWS